MKAAKSTPKLEALTHYIIWKCEDPTKLGATKLNKNLWYSDAYHYVLTGKPITEAVYRKLQFGPVPRDILAIKNKLVSDGKIVISDGIHFTKPQERLVALTRPDLSIFGAEQISVVDEIIEKICDGNTATSISEQTHKAFWWDKLPLGAEIPLYAAFAEPGDITLEQMQWANGQLKRLGLAA